MSSTERSKKIMDLFDEIYEQDEAIRNARLDDIGAKDPEMKDELVKLINNMKAADERSFMSASNQYALHNKGPAFERQIGPFKIEEVLAAGGMGTVYKARHVHLDRLIALKVPHLLHPNRDHLFDRLEREGKALAKLDHPNIVTVYDAGLTEDKVPFVAMAYLEGENLAHRYPNKKAAEEDVIKWGIQLAKALDYLHERQIYHRDIKTANIILDTNGNAILADFGIAYVEDMTRMTAANLPGTLAYMCPEQAKGRTIDGRCDIYSLGLVLFELLAGERPDEKSLRYYRPDISDKLIKAVEKCLENNPAHRYQTGADLARALNFRQKPVVQQERGRLKLFAGIAMLALMITAILWFITGKSEPLLIDRLVAANYNAVQLEEQLITLSREGSLVYGKSEDSFFNPQDCYVFIFERLTSSPIAVLDPGTGARKDILNDIIVDDPSALIDGKSAFWVLDTSFESQTN